MSGSRRTMRATCYRSGGLRLTRFICLAAALFLLFLHFFTFHFVVYRRLRAVYGPVKVVQTRKASVKGDLGTAVMVRGRPLSWGGTYVVGFRGPLQNHMI